MLIFLGASIAALGLLVMLVQKSGGNGWFGWFGNLPLDIRIEKENFRLYFPLGSSIVLSIILSLVIGFINKFFR
ncbi:DUF2905 domain-containing protein [Chlorobaculum sp. 24CR]|uniref:DUF2905 domain-containing protein n=1 Tax=Chlorobaculum sp. 24CR TaxID=2508878 RepID=UPI00100AE6BF|nr:DUF2905 domain-containing protein [Chlorobaculum sp. 24CR]RXK88951.1 DUF2905 domain-containing protein [Chlorobaculum sp. 24CR]